MSSVESSALSNFTVDLTNLAVISIAEIAKSAASNVITHVSALGTM
jgi:hypothetical protein